MTAGSADRCSRWHGGRWGVDRSSICRILGTAGAPPEVGMRKPHRAFAGRVFGVVGGWPVVVGSGQQVTATRWARWRDQGADPFVLVVVPAVPMARRCWR